MFRPTGDHPYARYHAGKNQEPTISWFQSFTATVAFLSAIGFVLYLISLNTSVNLLIEIPLGSNGRNFARTLSSIGHHFTMFEYLPEVMLGCVAMYGALRNSALLSTVSIAGAIIFSIARPVLGQFL